MQREYPSRVGDGVKFELDQFSIGKYTTGRHDGGSASEQLVRATRQRRTP